MSQLPSFLPALFDAFGNQSADVRKKNELHGDEDKEFEGLGSCSVMKAPTQKKHDSKCEDAELVDKSAFLQGKTVKLLLEISKKVVAYGMVVVAVDVLHGSPIVLISRFSFLFTKFL